MFKCDSFVLTAVLVVSAATLQGASFGPGEQLVITFTARANTSDLLMLFSNDPLTVTGTPTFTTTIYDGNTVLGTAVSPLFIYSGQSYFQLSFGKSGGGSGGNILLPTVIPFASINNGTIVGRIVTTITGGSISGFSASNVLFYDATSVSNGYRPQSDLQMSTPVLQALPALPHLAAGGTWTTGIFVINTAAQPATFSITIRDDNGNPQVLPFTTGSNSVIGGTLPALGSAYYEASNAQGPLTTGWGQIASDPSIVVQGLFRNSVNGTYYEAGVPSSAGSQTFELAFDATTFTPANAPTYTGIAVANLDATAAQITCTARDTSGSLINNAITVPTLAPYGHWANYLFPALVGKRGTISCTSTTKVAAIALRFIGTTAFSSLPVLQQ